MITLYNKLRNKHCILILCLKLKNAVNPTKILTNYEFTYIITGSIVYNYLGWLKNFWMNITQDDKQEAKPEQWLKT